MSRETFLKRVRAAAAAGRAHRVHLQGNLPPQVGYVGGGADPVARLAAEVDGAGGIAEVVDDLAAARLRLASLLDEYGSKLAVCWRHATLDRLGLSELLAGKNVEILNHATLAPLELAEQRLRMLAADVGISSVSWAIAETGTLAVASAPGQERLASLAPPVHIALVESAQILPDLFDLFARLEEAGADRLPGDLALITGPSKTGDLELRLTTGVHGPKQWHVIVVR